MNYQQQSLVGATGVQLVVGLYDAALRSLYRAKQAIAEDDVPGRRHAVAKVVDILLYLQSRLQPEASVTQSLSDFYAAMLSMLLEASHYGSQEGLDEVIACIRNVRDAWTVVARDPEAGRVLPQELKSYEEKYSSGAAVAPPVEQAAESSAVRWSA